MPKAKELSLPDAVAPVSGELDDFQQAKAEVLREQRALDVKRRFLRGDLRREFLKLDADLIAREKQANERQTSKSTDLSTNNVESDTIDQRQTNTSISLSDPKIEICNQFIHALATGDTLTVPAFQIPAVSIPEEARSALALRWADDLTHVEAGIPVEDLDAEKVNQSSAGLKAAAKAPHTLPSKIPEKDLFINRPRDPETGRKLTIDKFLQEGWPAPFAKARSLTMTDFRRLDPTGAFALYTYLRDGNVMPEGVDVPLKTQMVSEEVSHLDPEQVREARRLARAYDRRASQKNKHY